MLVPLPFKTFGDIGRVGYQVRVTCRCRKELIVDPEAMGIADRCFASARFRCTTILHNGLKCTAYPTVWIEKPEHTGMSRDELSLAMRKRNRCLTAPPIVDKLGTWGTYVLRGEVIWLSCDHCVPGFNIAYIAFDEPPWDAYLHVKMTDRFACPKCGKALSMTALCGPGAPGTVRFTEKGT